MDKKWKNLLLIVVVLLVIIAGFFLLQGISLVPEKTTVTVEEGFDEIIAVLSQNNLTFERLQKAEIILIEEGSLVNDFSENSFSSLQTDLQTLKAKFQAKENSSDKEALIKSIDLYLEVLELEKEEKELFNLAVSLNAKVTNLQSGCENRNDFVLLAEKELGLQNSLAELNDRTSELFVEFVDIDRIDILLLDIDTVTGMEDVYDFVIDAENIDYACSILLDPEGEA